MQTTKNDMEMVNHPKHYNAHPSGVECIDAVESLTFCTGNAIKYLFRAGHKGAALTDLKKALWYAKRELERDRGPRERGSLVRRALGALRRLSRDDENGRTRALALRVVASEPNDNVRQAMAALWASAEPIDPAGDLERAVTAIEREIGRVLRARS